MTTMTIGRTDLVTHPEATIGDPEDHLLVVDDQGRLIGHLVKRFLAPKGWDVIPMTAWTILSGTPVLRRYGPDRAYDAALVMATTLDGGVAWLLELDARLDAASKAHNVQRTANLVEDARRLDAARAAVQAQEAELDPDVCDLCGAVGLVELDPEAAGGPRWRCVGGCRR